MGKTDVTIGAVTALHRICESVDSIASTAMSHQRAFVIEVMGKNCGWLALMSAISCGADYVFLPEVPPPHNTEKYNNDWASEMCHNVRRARDSGARVTIVIVSEGAINRQLEKITTQDVRKALEERLGLDTRETNLGHVQRGGSPCFFDRFIAVLQGAEAVETILSTKKNQSSGVLIGFQKNRVVRLPLMQSVRLNRAIVKAISIKDFKKVMELRDPSFKYLHESFLNVTHTDFSIELPKHDQLRIGIIHIGAPASGMNAVTRTAVRLCIARGHIPVGIRNGFNGLIRDEVSVITWPEVMEWKTKGGSELGTERVIPKSIPGSRVDLVFQGVKGTISLGHIAYHLQKHNINCMILIGGFEAYISQLVLFSARTWFPAFCIPMILIPAAYSNNVPGTENCVGSDTALNQIVESCDIIKTSATASHKR